MKKNLDTGKYEASKFIKRTNQEITAEGDTKEEAKANLKAKLKAYSEDPSAQLQPTGLYLPSPGFVFAKDETGRISYRYNTERKAQVVARPDLAEYLRDLRSKDVVTNE